MKKKPTQLKAVIDYLIANGKITNSECMKTTKSRCWNTCTNLHKIIAKMRDMGYVFKQPIDKSNEVCSGWHRTHILDKKKTPKKLLQIS